MHVLLFELKRAHQRSLLIPRKLTELWGLTPARFDLLFTLLREGPSSVWQSKLRRRLGVTPPTVSRMLRSLEQLGYIVRRKSSYDRRQRDVFLTAAGRFHLRCALRFAKRKNALKHAVERTFAATPRRHDSVWPDLLAFRDTLELACRRLKDSARNPYPSTFPD